MSTLSPNPVLKRLGFSNTDRLVIIHVDDVGMCQASIAAFEELWAAHIISSGAVMVPCPWFPQAAAFARSHPEADLGVHATLTSEWQTYRWGPVSTRDPRSGLMDEEGFFPRRSPMVQASADPAAAAVELEAQVKRALQFGIQPSHFDTHMGSVAHAKFIQGYVQVGMQYHLPLLIFRRDQAAWQAMGLDPLTAAGAAQISQQLEANGFPLLDAMTGLELNQPVDRLGQAKAALSALQPGVTHFIIHAAKDTPELRAITPDWQCRVLDYETFLRDDLRQFIKEQGIQVIGYRDLQKTIE